MILTPRPPSVRSSRSARSEGSRANLELRHRHEQLKAQILKDMQLNTTGGRKGAVFRRMQAVAGDEAARVLGAGAGAVPAPAEDLLALIKQSARGAWATVDSLPAVTMSAVDPRGLSGLPPLAGPSATTVAAPGRGVRVDVAGKGIPLTTMMVDKLGQRGGQQRPGGVPQQLRKAFKKVDADKDGKISLAELQEILSTVHITISEDSLRRQFLKWTGGSPLLEWNTFIQQILPEDFPTTYNAKLGGVHDIASMAQHDAKENNVRYGGLVTNLRDWEVAFRDKIMAKTRGGPLELRKAWIKFDVDRSGDVTVDDIIQTCASWNLYPTDEVKQQLLDKYCSNENRAAGVVRFYDFTQAVVAEDFKSSAQTIRELKKKLEENWLNLRDQFRITDADRSGDISLNELQEVLMRLNIPMNAATTEAVFKAIDKDGSDRITFAEFVDAMGDIDKTDIPGMGGKLLWEQEPPKVHNLRPQRADSIASHNGDKGEQQGKSGHVFVDVDASGKFVVNTAVTRYDAQQRPGATVNEPLAGGAYAVDLMQLVRNKIYQKYGEKGFYSWLRRACLSGVSAVDRHEHLDTMTKHIDPHPASVLHADQNLSLLQWRRMLKELGLQLTDAAFAACIQTFSPDGSDTVPFSSFIDAMAGGATSHALGLPSENAPNGRLVPMPPVPQVTPRSLSPYGVLSHDPVALVRYKIGQLTATRSAANPLAMGARRRLRDEFAVLDPTLSQRCTRLGFLSVLARYNIHLQDGDWGAFAAKYAGAIVMSDGQINYKRFLADVLDPNAADSGFYTPRAAGRVQRPKVSARTTRALQTPTIKLGQDLAMAPLNQGWMTTR